MKKVLILVLGTSIIVSLLITLSITALAATDGYYTYTVSDGVATITDCDTSISGNITIPASLGGYTVDKIGREAFCECDGLTSVALPNTVTKIESMAFYRCEKLKSISMPNSVKEIGLYAFSGCESIINITIPSSVTQIGSGAFDSCPKLNSIKVESTNTNYCDVDGNLYNKQQTILIRYAIGKTESHFSIPNTVKTIQSYAFRDCVNLKNIIVPNTVITIGDSAFSGCEELENINIPNGVTTIGFQAFAQCGKLKKIEIPSSVQTIGNYAFGFCESLIDILVDDNNENYCDINGVLFNKNKSLQIQYPSAKVDSTYVIPNTVTTIENDAFRDCINLKNIIIPNTVTNIGESVFSGCRNLTDIIIPEGVTSIGEDTFSMCSSLTSITIPKSITSIERWAFYACRSLEKVNYNGDLTAWCNISIGERNEDLTDATIKYIWYVDFYEENGQLVLRTVNERDAALDLINIPKKSGYTTKLYIDSSYTSVFDATMPITSNTNLYVAYETNKYTYKFLDNDGTTLKEETIDYGATIVPPDIPTDKDPYTFDYWEGFIEGMTIEDDIIFTATYKYKKYNVSVVGFKNIKSEAVFNSSYTIIPATKYGYEFLGYYTEENGQGTKLTDENGNSLAVYTTEGDTSVYPHFKDLLCNKAIITGNDDVTVGDTNVKYTVSLGTDKEDIQYTTIAVKYPRDLTIKKAIANGFDEASIDKITEYATYNVAEISCIYSYDGNAIPTLTPIEAFELVFDVGKTAIDRDVTIELTPSSILIGDGNYSFDNLQNINVTIKPKLSESITIEGLAEIDRPTQYIANIYPDYTKEKAVTWSVDDETFATISVDGTLTPIKNGTVTVKATAVDCSEIFATKTVNVIVYAQITSLTTSGEWEETFENGKKNYIIYVDENADSFNISATYSKGTLRVNGSTLLPGNEKSVDLTDVETTITLDRLSVDEMTDISYTLTVIKTKPFTKVMVSEDGKSFNVRAYLVEDGKKMILALYKDDKLVKLYNDVTVSGKSIPFNVTESYDTAKVMVWDGFNMLKPLCSVKELPYDMLLEKINEEYNTKLGKLQEELSNLEDRYAEATPKITQARIDLANLPNQRDSYISQMIIYYRENHLAVSSVIAREMAERDWVYYYSSQTSKLNAIIVEEDEILLKYPQLIIDKENEIRECNAKYETDIFNLKKKFGKE